MQNVVCGFLVNNQVWLFPSSLARRMQCVKISRKDLNFWFVSPHEFSTWPPSILNEFTTRESFCTLYVHFSLHAEVLPFLRMQQSCWAHTVFSDVYGSFFFQLCGFKWLFIFPFFFKMILCTIYDEISKLFTIFCFVAVCTLTLSPLISFLLQIMLPINLMYVSRLPIIWIIVSFWHLFLALNTK